MRWFRHKQSVGEVVGAAGRSNRRLTALGPRYERPADFEDRAKHSGPIG